MITLTTSEPPIPMKIFRAFLITVCISCLCVQVIAEDSPFPVQRAVSIDGRKLEVIIIGIENDSVILRHVDGIQQGKIELIRLSKTDRDFLSKLVKGSDEPKNAAIKIAGKESWLLENFQSKLILQQHRGLASIAVGKNGPVIAYADKDNIRLIMRSDTHWNAEKVYKSEGILSDNIHSLSLHVCKDQKVHLTYNNFTDLRNNILYYITNHHGSWAQRESKTSLGFETGGFFVTKKNVNTSVYVEVATRKFGKRGKIPHQHA
jgi:hypothetical protein